VMAIIRAAAPTSARPARRGRTRVTATIPVSALILNQAARREATAVSQLANAVVAPPHKISSSDE
jgi:hypothetical protein